MKNYVTVNADLYIRRNDLTKLDKGEAVTGYKFVVHPENYELIRKYAFLPAIQVNKNEYSVYAINK